MVPISAMATASMVMMTAVVVSSVMTRALTYRGSLAGPASRLVTSILAAPARSWPAAAGRPTDTAVTTTATNDRQWNWFANRMGRSLSTDVDRVSISEFSMQYDVGPLMLPTWAS